MAAQLQPVLVDVDELEGISKLMLEQQETIAGELSKLRKLYEGLADVWSGEDYEQFQSLLAQNLPFVDGANGTLQDATAEVSRAVLEYRRLEAWINEFFADPPAS